MKKDAEYYRNYRATKRNQAQPDVKSATATDKVQSESATKAESATRVQPVKWHPEVNQAIFDGHGRGVPVDGFVMISMGSVPEGDDECQVVTQDAWQARMNEVCSHGLKGWTCKKCLH